MDMNIPIATIDNRYTHSIELKITDPMEERETMTTKHVLRWNAIHIIYQIENVCACCTWLHIVPFRFIVILV